MVNLLIAAKEKLEIVIRAAPPPFRIFAGGLPRRLRWRSAFGLIQEYCALFQWVTNRTNWGSIIDLVPQQERNEEPSSSFVRNMRS